MSEIWKPVVGYEGLYEVSNTGKVRSLNYLGKGIVKVLRPSNTNGYLQVWLSKNGKRKICYVHRLVAETFLDNPNSLPVVNHRNEKKSDNRVENLEWCTQKYNVHYSDIWNNKGKTGYRPILQFTKSGEFVKEYPSLCEVERQTGIRRCNIYLCCRGRYKSSGGYVWRYK